MVSQAATKTSGPKDKVAYATFYSTRLSDDRQDDPYFDAVQILIYQLLHRPSTRTRYGIPLLVFVLPHVSKARRATFRLLGATIVEIGYVQYADGWISPRRDRWVDQLSKLRIFEQTTYDRILYLDADMLLTKSLDDIWNEPFCNERLPTLPHKSHEAAAAQLPHTYLFVGVPDTYGSRKPDPPITYLPESINGGFWLASPSREIFAYYTSLLAIPDSFDGQYMEQGVFRHAHREDGPMPWRKFEARKWNVNWPRVEDLYRGTATLHDRFWITDEAWMEEELVASWEKAKGEMLVLRRALEALVLSRRRRSVDRRSRLTRIPLRKEVGVQCA